MRFKAFFCVSLCTWIFGCVDPYLSPDIKVPVALFVVDGYINVSSNSATIRLSQAVPLDTTVITNPIGGATVWIESDDNTNIFLSEQAVGSYGISDVAFDMNAHYRLHLKISNDEYASDYVELKRTPELDSVTYRQEDDALRIAVNTHTPDNSGRYFKWDYVETWEYETSLVSNYKLVGDQPIHRTAEEYITRCYGTNDSKRILISNTASLSQDVVRDFPITVVPGGTFQLTRRYSINVKQRALANSEYQYWLQLQRTSESLGTLFDPQPGQVTGNIHNINNDEVVLGYFGGGEVVEKRLFINFGDLPDRLKTINMKAICTSLDRILILLEDLKNANGMILLDPFALSTGPIIGYDATFPRCADCTLFGGVTQKPDFW